MINKLQIHMVSNKHFAILSTLGFRAAKH